MHIQHNHSFHNKVRRTVEICHVGYFSSLAMGFHEVYVMMGGICGVLMFVAFWMGED